jgi:cellulose synthase/poly-beta-1,6-N-acetylglucosamine synthase-like glycosyltransferase
MNFSAYLLAPVLVLYTLIMTALVAYILNMLYLAFVGLAKKRFLRDDKGTMRANLPRVTVQLPIYNERYVAERLLKACAALDYPRDLLEIQALDDSTDDTAALVAKTVERLRTDGVNVVHIHRADRAGFKAGALANGLATARGEFIAIFDADFVPPPDFLRRILPHFDHEKAAFVQARWGHLNRDYSLLTLLQSLSLDAHFAIDQLVRSRQDFAFNFNGTAGVWRKSAILDAGGWKADTLTEDMDLSYRAFLRGWTARYAGDVEAPAELPVSITAYRRQQYRWARGILECAVKYLPVIWRSDFTFARKLHATLHLTSYLLHLFTVALMLIYPLLLMFSMQFPQLLAPVGLGVFMSLFALVPAFYFSVGQHVLRRRWLHAFPLIALMTMLASGMALNTVRAIFQILQKRLVPFERTPKFGITRRDQSWRGNRYTISVEPLIVYEILLGALNLFTAWFAFQLGYYLMTIYASVFALGLFYCSGLTIAQAVSTRFLPDPEVASS